MAPQLDAAQHILIEHPNPDPLAPIRYACVYWVDHLCEIKSGHDKVGGSMATDAWNA
jgi:hypothetical protein